MAGIYFQRTEATSTRSLSLSLSQKDEYIAEIWRSQKTIRPIKQTAIRFILDKTNEILIKYTARARATVTGEYKRINGNELTVLYTLFSRKVGIWNGTIVHWTINIEKKREKKKWKNRTESGWMCNTFAFRFIFKKKATLQLPRKIKSIHFIYLVCAPKSIELLATNNRLELFSLSLFFTLCYGNRSESIKKWFSWWRKIG